MKVPQRGHIRISRKKLEFLGDSSDLVAQVGCRIYHTIKLSSSGPPRSAEIGTYSQNKTTTTRSVPTNKKVHEPSNTSSSVVSQGFCKFYYVLGPALLGKFRTYLTECKRASIYVVILVHAQSRAPPCNL